MMSHIDEKFKDASPVATVEKIQSLLKEHGIDLDEMWLDSGIENCYSVRVSIAGTTLATNGKGVSRELARASGHAELMERLQSGYRGSGVIRFNDAKAMSQREILDECGEYLAIVSQKILAKEGVQITPEQLANALCGFDETKKALAVPFLNVMNSQTVNLPISLIRVLCSSTGLAAGNSTEEALVQGLSEIVERYCQDRFLREKITPPTVPEEYLAQFPTASSIIRQTREAGYTVMIKDCSLGEGYPVVASIVIDPKTHHYRVIFGASPLFEIALERSLTEMYQGQVVQKLAKTVNVFTGKVRSINDLEGAFVAGATTYPIEFFENNDEFTPFEDRSALTNKDLLAWAMEYLKKKNCTMFVRDLSHYGFGTYRIYIPGMSETSPWQFRGNPSHYRLSLEVGGVGADLKRASFDQLLAFTMYYKTAANAGGGVPDYTALSGAPLQIAPEMNRHLSYCCAAYAEWQIGNIQQAYRYAVGAKNFAQGEMKDHWEYICRVIAMRFDGYAFEKSVAMLEKFFAPELAPIMQANFAKNPFERYVPTCDKACDKCEFADRCLYRDHKAVIDQLNEVVAKYDNDAAFERLRKCFASLPKV